MINNNRVCLNRFEKFTGRKETGLSADRGYLMTSELSLISSRVTAETPDGIREITNNKQGTKN